MTKAPTITEYVCLPHCKNCQAPPIVRRPSSAVSFRLSWATGSTSMLFGPCLRCGTSNPRAGPDRFELWYISSSSHIFKLSSLFFWQIVSLWSLNTWIQIICNRWIGKPKTLKSNALQTWFLWGKTRHRQDFFVTECAAGKTYIRKCGQDFFNWILMNTLSYWCSIFKLLFTKHWSQSSFSNNELIH